MMDVFVCATDLRTEFLGEVLGAWRRIGVSPVLLRPSSDVISFQRDRRIRAERMAAGPVYVLADDDCIPLEEDCLRCGATLMTAYPTYGILSLWPLCASINPWTPEGYEVHADQNVMEHVSVGGIRFCRWGVLGDWQWPAQVTRSYDADHCEAVRRMGFRVGYMKQRRMAHLGEGKSTVWRSEDICGARSLEAPR